MTFEGMQDTALCVIDHPDYRGMVNKAVSLQVGPHLKWQNGKSYQHHPGVSQEQYVFFNNFCHCFFERLASLCSLKKLTSSRPRPTFYMINISQ